MSENKINAEKITKPIQLLAVWLIGLIALVGSLLTAAGTIHQPDWMPVFLAISAVSIIPMFLGLIFLLQTRYRPEMQEDLFYSKYLEKDSQTFEDINNENSNNLEIDELKREILSISESTKEELEKIRTVIKQDDSKSNQSKISEIIEKSDDKLDKLKELIKFASIDLKINIQLKNYNKVLEIIKSIGFINFSEFGKNKTAPAKLVISIGGNIQIDVIKTLVVDLIPLGATSIRMRLESSNAIYIGSYNTEDLVPINEELISALLSLEDQLKFSNFMVKYLKK
jgi:hypothetical protein